MSKRYLVESKRQVADMTCVPTAIWMMHRWYLDKNGASSAFPIFDAIVNVTEMNFALQEVAVGGRHIGDGLQESNIVGFVQKLGVQSKSLPIEAQAIDAQLKSYGPFVYFAQVSQDRLSATQLMQAISQGRSYGHAILITGITTKGSGGQVYYNDPATGTSSSKEFKRFSRDFSPMTGRNEPLILYISRPISSPDLTLLRPAKAH